jgi:hypoxanthine phosphoribosyltransferase
LAVPVSVSEMDHNLTLYLPQEKIAAAVKRLAEELDQEYRHRSPVAVGVMKGALVFLADLVRQLNIPLRGIELVQVSSYGAGSVTSGRARMIKSMPEGVIQGQDVILVEDIIDTGITTSTVLKHLCRHRPASLEVCTLLDKPARRIAEVSPRFVGFTIPDCFVVGYGLDLDQRYRELPDIYTVDE